MDINSVNQIFSQKLQDIDSRLPDRVSINRKFQSILEQTQQGNTNSVQENKATSTNNDDISSLLKTMISTQSLLNNNSAFSGDSSSGIFPTSSFNNAINSIQQAQLLKALGNSNKSSSGN